MRKNFLLGVGCQKSGTTWLHRQLVDHENADMGFAKEYHIFDGLHVPDCAHYRKRAARDVLQGHEVHTKKHLKKQQRRSRFYRDTYRYFNYFDRLADKSNQTLLVGDITPAYCALPVEVYQEIRKNLLARGFRVRVVFFMRDPFERIWSMARMKLNSTKKRSSLSETDAILKHYSTEYTKVRTRYDLTIQRLEQVFAVDEVYYEFYERQFDQQRIKVLMDFLGLPHKELDLAKRIHGTDKGAPISDDVIALVAKEYRETYEFVSQRFGKSLIEDLWPSTQFL